MTGTAWTGSIRHEVAQAMRERGHPTPFCDALEALCHALDTQASCHARGAASAIKGLLDALDVQTALRWDARHPADAPRWDDGIEQRLDHAVFIVGLPRSGTTYLHNLMGLHGGLTGPLLWELLTPCGPATPEAVRGAQDKARRYVDDYYARAPGMRVVHPMDAHRPDECQRLLGNAFSTLIFAIRHNVPAYGAWYRDADLTGAYRFHRRQLGAILARRRDAGLGPVGLPLLKDPFHVWHLDALRAVYPKAVILHIERPLEATLPSTCSLTESARQGSSDIVEPLEIGRFWREQFAHVMARLPADLARVPARQLLPIRYGDLVRSPMGVARQIAELVGLPIDAASMARMAAFIADKPLLAAGKHVYDASRYGLDAGDTLLR